jgi:hypothetical protein
MKHYPNKACLLNPRHMSMLFANGSSFDLYINHQKIDSASDSTYSQGSIDLFADAPDNATMVTYQNVWVWTIG